MTSWIESASDSSHKVRQKHAKAKASAEFIKQIPDMHEIYEENKINDKSELHLRASIHVQGKRNLDFKALKAFDL